MKWVGKQTQEKTTEDIVGCGDLTSIVAVTKNHLHCQNNWGSVHKRFFSWNDFEIEINFRNRVGIPESEY